MIPKQYSYLLSEPGPKMILEAIKLVGTLEAPGAPDNPVIIAWAKEANVQGYTHDQIAWCGLFMSVVATRAQKIPPVGPLWALNWSKFGIKVTDGPMLGDVLTFRRSGGGHVALYVGEDDLCYHILGGNQGDSVSFTRKEKEKLYAVRRPIYNVQPANIRRIFLNDTGIISQNEA